MFIYYSKQEYGYKQNGSKMNLVFILMKAPQLSTCLWIIVEEFELLLFTFDIQERDCGNLLKVETSSRIQCKKFCIICELRDVRL